MNKHIIVAASALAMFGLAGCINNSSPQGIVGSAYKALSKNDTKAFTKTLTGAAKQQFGTLEGMIALQKELNGLDVTIGETKLVSSAQDSRGWDNQRVYTVVVLGKKTGDSAAVFTPVLSAETECEVSYHYEGRGAFDRYPYDPTYPGYHHGPYPYAAELEKTGSTRVPYYMQESVYCLISKIDL